MHQAWGVSTAIEDAQIKLSMEGFASDTAQKLRRIIVVMKDAPNMQRKEESVLDMVQKLRSRSVSSHEGCTNIVKKGGFVRDMELNRRNVLMKYVPIMLNRRSCAKVMFKSWSLHQA